MLQTMRNAWKVEDIRRKILFTLLIILLYRLGNAVPVPYVNVESLNSYFTSMQNTVLGLLNVMSGGAFSNATIFALSIQPYINASIIIQLLTIAIPALERMSKEEGEEGKKKIASITRYTTVVIGLIQGFAYYMMIKNYGFLELGDTNAVWAAIVIILTFTSGSALIMWLGEQITEFGIGNGISIILFASIVSRFPGDLYKMIYSASNGVTPWWVTVLMLLGALAMIVLIVFINDAERKLPVQYAKRVVGRKQYGGQSTHIPIKVCNSGVMPIIFAMSFMSLPATISMFVEPVKNITDSTTFGQKIYYYFINFFKTQSYSYAVLYFILIIAFNYFYVSMQYNPVEMANNLRQSNGGIPGIRPGKPTADYISKVLSKLTLVGAVFLGIIAIFPIIFVRLTNMPISSMGGTSVLIVVSVAIETVRTLESQLMMRHHKGFLG